MSNDLGAPGEIYAHSHSHSLVWTKGYWHARPIHQGVPYRRADTVVDKQLAEKMAEAMRPFVTMRNQTAADQIRLNEALAAYDAIPK